MNPEEEIEEGQLAIQNDVLICQHKYGMFNSTVKLAKLEYAYAMITINKSPILFLFDSHQHRIPTNFKGYSKIYKTLSEKFGFDDDLYFKTVKSDIPTKNRIWKREYKENYKIKDKGIPIDSGIQVYDTGKTLIDWDLPLELLLKYNFINQYFDDYDQLSIQFLVPVQIGQIKIDSLKANIARNNIKAPVNNFYFQLRNAKGNDQSYYEAKESLSNSLSINPKTTSHERDDQNHLNFIDSEINISITYWYDDKHSYESNYTSLNIKNNRTYSKLSVNYDKSNLDEIEEYVILNCTLFTPDSYKENENIKEKPDVIKTLSKSNPCVWRNREKATIGFSGSVYSQEFKEEDIISIHLRNIYPAKGSGSSNLEIKIRGKKGSNYILRGKYQELDSYIPNLEKVVKQKIIIEKEWADV